MNVLILTPDAVGSTLLQRVLTIYMQFHEFDKPVINIHELTNGIVKYYSPEFGREILGKDRGPVDIEGYHQTLAEIVEILKSADHYKVARVAQYHIDKRRRDPFSEQVPFYRYLDDNFFVISCRRKNLFEHALSWGLIKVTKKLNVYSAQEKISTFFDLYRSRVELDTTALIYSLNCYRDYLRWSDDNFSVGSYFHYEDHVGNLERYVLNLPVFASQPQRVTWKQTYGQEFNEWNRCHYLSSDIGSLALENQQTFLQLAAPKVEYNAPALIDHRSPEQIAFLKEHNDRYVTARDSISRMIELGIMTSPVPVKKQTMAEKRYLVKNFAECVAVYNDWVEKNPGVAEPFSDQELEEHIQREREIWRLSSNSSTMELSYQPTDQQ